MFAVLVVERNIPTLNQLHFMVLGWLEVVGGVALLTLIIYGLTRVFSGLLAKPGNAAPAFHGTALAVVILISIVCYAVGGTMEGMARSQRRFMDQGLLIHCIMGAGGLVAILGIVAPVLRNLTQISPRRVWALARLSFKEALRRRILLAFSVILVGFLFAGWFLPAKPEHQLATYVEFVFAVMSFFLILIAVLLASFGIPTDLKTQTMYTIITKPVERFEIVLGRCVGYVLLMTVVLAAMSAMSLIYIARGIDPDARAESYKARVPIFGNFNAKKAVSVGREWEYRHYIQGGVTDDEAIWTFPALAGNLASRSEPVPCEFAFDIFRTTKGKEGRKIRCSFLFTNQKWDIKNEAAYKQALDAALERPDPAIDVEVSAQAQKEGWNDETRQNVLHARRRDKIAEQFGIYERLSKEMADYHTFSVAVPAGLFKNVNEDPGLDAEGNPKQALTIKVRCEDATQYLGVARHDLYLLNAERPFELNFFKGAVGIWCRMVLVIVLAVSLSTYLSGIVSAITTGFLYLAGLIVGFIQEVAMGRTQGGGPFEAFIRLARGSNLMAPLEQTATIKTAIALDYVFRFMLQPFLLVIPDVHRYDLKDYVAQGFDVSGAQIFADNIVPLAGYLIPWIVLAFYMMRSREIAS